MVADDLDPVPLTVFYDETNPPLIFSTLDVYRRRGMPQ